MSYYLAVCARAWRDAAALLTRQGIFLGLLVAVLTAAITGWAGAGVGERFNVGLAVFAAVGAALVVAALALAWCLVAAPWRLHAELAARLQAFERRPDVSPLVALRERGVQLLNSDNQFILLEMDIRRWENETVAELEKCATRSDVSWFKVLGEFRARVFLGATEEINREKTMLAERLDSLFVIIRRVEGGAEGRTISP
jgi:hypothetical protein